MSRLSFNSMTADRWSLAEVIDACAEHGIGWIGPWRHKLAELGVEEARVLGTPHMIGHMERTARNTVLPYLEPGHDTVGTVVNVAHLAATPLGMSVRFRAEVLSVADRRVTFKVEAFDEVEKIGEGTHERFIVNIGRFAQRVQAKLR